MTLQQKKNPKMTEKENVVELIKKNVGGKEGRASRAHGVFEEKRGEKGRKTKRKRRLYKKPI